MARTRAQFKDISRPVKEGDRIEINFEGFEKGVPIENLTSKNYPVILGSRTLIPEFEEKLVGLKKGDKKEFKVEMTVPGTNEKSAQGGSASGRKNIDFNVEVLTTQEVILPKIDDEFAKQFQKKNLEELKKAIAEDVVKQKKLQEQRNTENAVLEELLKIIKVDVPDSLIEQEINRQIETIKSRAQMMNLTFEKYLENIKKTVEDFRKDLRPQAEKTIKIGLALGEIVKKEGIDPKDKEAGKKALYILIANATK